MKHRRSTTKTVSVMAAAIILLSVTAACTTPADDSFTDATAGQSVTVTEPESTSNQNRQLQTETEEENMNTIEIRIDGTSFYAELYDNEAAHEFASMLPLTVEMSDLHANEKYYYLPESLPTDAHRPGSIRTGDLMLYGSDCIVLFYKDFSTSYSYTPLGRIQDTQGLENALGSAEAEITFRQQNR